MMKVSIAPSSLSLMFMPLKNDNEAPRLTIIAKLMFVVCVLLKCLFYTITGYTFVILCFKISQFCFTLLLSDLDGFSFNIIII